MYENQSKILQTAEWKKPKETLLFLNIFIKSFLKYFLSNQRLKKMFDKIFNFIKIKFITMIT